MIFERKREIIFVDFFDTIMYRDIHSSQLLPEWERIMKNKYGIPREINLQKIRCSVSGSRGSKCYRDVIHEIYFTLRQMGYCSCEEEEFYEVSYQSETFLDFATQYPNWKMIRYLRRQKKKD